MCGNASDSSSSECNISLAIYQYFFCTWSPEKNITNVSTKGYKQYDITFSLTNCVYLQRTPQLLKLNVKIGWTCIFDYECIPITNNYHNHITQVLTWRGPGKLGGLLGLWRLLHEVTWWIWFSRVYRKALSKVRVASLRYREVDHLEILYPYN